MKTQILSAIVIFAFLPSALANRVEKVVSYIRSESLRADFSVVTPDIRDEVIARIRKEADGPLQKLNLGGLTDYTLLLRLGDEKTMTELVLSTREAFLGGSGLAFHEELGRSAQPALIPLIAEDFFRNDGAEVLDVRQDDVVGVKRPFSIVMCRVALEIVFRSDSFADATRKWARDTVWRTDESPTLTREVLQRWWQANEKSLAEKNYRAVPPGESLPLPTKMAASPGPPPANEFEPQTKTIPTELNKGTAKTTAIPRRETEGITHNQVASHWLLIAIGMVVVVIGSLIWRMRAK